MHGSRWTLDRLADHLTSVLASQKTQPSKVIVGYSGGADSTALLLGLLEVSSRGSRIPTNRPRHARAIRSNLLGSLEVVAAHVDHQLDDQSTLRADQAQAIAGSLLQRFRTGATNRQHHRMQAKASPHAHHRFVRLCPLSGTPGASVGKSVSRLTGQPETERTETGPTEPASHGVEADARTFRYSLLEKLRLAQKADLVLTAHHEGDQLETLILRLRQGTGIHGLTGVRCRHEHVLRPLLGTCNATGPLASDLIAVLKTERVPWVNDPTNFHLNFQRNLVRHRILPAIMTREAGINGAGERCERTWCEQAQRLAATTLRSVTALDRRLTHLLEIEQLGPTSASLDFQCWLKLPTAVQNLALHSLHRKLGLHYGPTRAARGELRRQIEAAVQPSQRSTRCRYVKGAIGCACGGGWMWRVRKLPRSASHSQRLILEPQVICNRAA